MAAPVRPWLGSLLDVVPEGASMVVWAHPDALWHASATHEIVGALLPPTSLHDLATRTGVDLRIASEAVVAEYPGGVLLLVRGPFVASELVAEAEVRMSSVESRSESPFVRRAGMFGQDRRDLVALDHDVLAVATDLEPLSAMLGCALALRRGDPSHACHSAVPAGALRAAHARAPLVLFAPGHLDLPPGLGASLLLAEERDLAVDVTPGSDSLALDVDLRGDFPPQADANFRSLAESLARSELGAVMGLDASPASLRIRTDAGGMRLSTELPADAVVRGLRTLFGGEIREMLSDVTH